MAPAPLNLEVKDAGDGVVVVAVGNPTAETVVLVHAPVVGIRAVATDRRWRGACRFDPVPSPTSLPPGGRAEWRIGWAEALRRADGPPPAGEYDVQVVFQVAPMGAVTISQPVACANRAAASNRDG